MVTLSHLYRKYIVTTTLQFVLYSVTAFLMCMSNSDHTVSVSDLPVAAVKRILLVMPTTDLHWKAEISGTMVGMPSWEPLRFDLNPG